MFNFIYIKYLTWTANRELKKLDKLQAKIMPKFIMGHIHTKSKAVFVGSFHNNPIEYIKGRNWKKVLNEKGIKERVFIQK